MFDYEIPIDHSPAHAEALGRIVAHFVYIEALVEDIFTLLMRTDSLRCQVVSRAIMSFPGRVQIVRRLAENYVDPCQAKDALFPLLKRAQDLSTERNEFVHALWKEAIDDNLTRTRVVLPHDYKKLGFPDKDVSASDLEELCNRIAECAHSLQMWYFRSVSELPVRELPRAWPQTEENGRQDQ